MVERDDGYVETETIAWYFGGLRQWHPSERQALRHVRGRVLDIGAGAGRAALELQKRGHEVVAVDISPLAIDVCRKRGVRDARVLPVTKIDSSLGTFDTVALFGNNFGLFATARRARWMLRRLRATTAPDARIIAVSYDPYRNEESRRSRVLRAEPEARPSRRANPAACSVQGVRDAVGRLPDGVARRDERDRLRAPVGRSTRCSPTTISSWE